jgi:hypothetical protein
MYNDLSGRQDEQFFLAAEEFIAKRIEIFEVADWTSLPAHRQKCGNRRELQEIVRNASGRVFEAAASRRMSPHDSGGRKKATSGRERR